MVHGFDPISITQFPVMIGSVSAEGSLNRVAHSIQTFLLLTLSKSFLFNLCVFTPCLPLSSTYMRLCLKEFFETTLRQKQLICKYAYKREGDRKLVLRYVRTRWMTPNKCCGIFFVHSYGQVH